MSKGNPEASAVGRSREIVDRLDPERARALHAALARNDPPPESGDPLPAFWHQIYFWDIVPSDRLGSDGHARTGDFIPEFGLAQRMWAGGRLKVERPLVLGVEARKVSVIEGISERQGRSGRLVFVTLRHEFSQGGHLALIEHQDLVYRNAGGSPVPKPAGQSADGCRAITFDPVLLFRYSALTFNGHRIHYDADYCREVAGYPGLVVHGPLLASLLVDEAESCLKRLGEFEYRATAPTFSGEQVQICRRDAEDGLRLWMEDSNGGLRMSAAARAARRNGDKSFISPQVS